MKNYRVFVAPIDVCLSSNTLDPKKITEWVQPDLDVVCNEKNIAEQKIITTPQLIVEVLSPSTAKKDRKIKFHRCQQPAT